MCAYVELTVTQTEPAFESQFLTTGGSLECAEARSKTDLALSGSTQAVSMHLHDRCATVMRIPVPEKGELYDFAGSEDGDTVEGYTPSVRINARAKLMVLSSRVGVAINGTIGTHESGRGAVYLADMLRASSHVAVPCSYTNYEAHTCVLAVSNARVLDAKGCECAVEFFADDSTNDVLAKAEGVMSRWAENAWAMRTDVAALYYEAAPALTKSVVKTTLSRANTGINDSAYTLIHNVIKAMPAQSYATIDALLAHGIATDLECDEDDIKSFYDDTAAPGMKAARQASTLAAALSLIASYSISYRCDGRSRMNVGGMETVDAENWPQVPHRTADRTGDCDDSAIYIHGIAQSIIHAPSEVLATCASIRAAQHVLVPYYTVGVSVVSAACPEASGPSPESHAKGVAGHAVALMIPTMSALVALECGSCGVVKNEEVCPSASRPAMAEARFNATFPRAVVAKMPASEQSELSSFKSAKAGSDGLSLEPFGMEGTTPASARLYAEGSVATRACRNAKRDAAAFRAVGPTTGRSMKVRLPSLPRPARTDASARPSCSPCADHVCAAQTHRQLRR